MTYYLSSLSSNACYGLTMIDNFRKNYLSEVVKWSSLSILHIYTLIESRKQEKYIENRLQDPCEIDMQYKVNYDGDKLTKANKLELLNKITYIAKKCGMVKSQRKKINIEIERKSNKADIYGFRSIPCSQTIVIPEKAALQLVNKESFESTTNSEPKSMNELKVLISHELGHLVYPRSFSNITLLKDVALKTLPFIASFLFVLGFDKWWHKENCNEPTISQIVAFDLCSSLLATTVGLVISKSLRLLISSDKTEEVFADHYGDKIQECLDGRRSLCGRLALIESKKNRTFLQSLKSKMSWNRESHPEWELRSKY